MKPVQRKSFSELLVFPSNYNKEGWPWTVDHSVSEQGMAIRGNLPKISIITPSLNQGRFIEQAIRSVLLQNYPNLEYIIIDGGSTDNSLEVIKKYESYLTYWTSEPDSGHGNALNKGFAHATGEILGWLNSDDMYAPSAFFTIAQIFNDFHDIQWITGKNSWWDEKDRQMSTTYVYKNIYDFMIGSYRWIQQESTFWRRALWEKTGSRINEQYQYMVDGELWCRFFLLAEPWHVDAILGGYRSHSSNRAKLYYDDVNLEMKKAVSELYRICPKQIKREAQILKYIRMIKKLLNHFHINKLLVNKISQKFMDKLEKDAAYKTLIYRNGSWAKIVTEF